MASRIMIDGYNLGLEKGTGIATYARNLTYRVGALGYEVDVLYGVRSNVGKNKLLAEVGFFDPTTKPVKAHHIIRRLLTSRLGIEARRVPITGQVISKNFRNRLPHYDRIFNARDVYSFAQWHYRVHQNFLSVHYDDAPSLAHWTYPMPIKLKNAANIYTIHDLVPLRLPYATLDHKRHFYRVHKRICDEADHVVTVSEKSRRDIIEIFGISEDRVTNTYQSASFPKWILERSENEVAGEIDSVFGLEFKDYLLFYGAIEPKKNIGRIIEAYLSSGVKRSLVIVGSLVWKDANELKLIETVMARQPGKKAPLPAPLAGMTTPGDNSAAPLVQADDQKAGGLFLPAIAAPRQPNIVRMEYLPISLLVSLIRGARAVVFPSLYEGFGLPILEAMQLGTPVITGTEGSNPEVAGDAAILADPYDTVAIAAAMRKIDEDDDIVDHLIAAGRVQAKNFSPSAYEERIQALYSKLM